METEVTPHYGRGHPKKATDSNPHDAPKIEARTEMHAEDPREAARIREAQILENFQGIDEAQDEYWIDQAYIPDGWSWEWKIYSVLNEVQQSRINAYKRTGWDFVPPSKYPMIPPTNGIIIHRGNALMERPASITKMMSDRDQKMAKAQMDSKTAQLEGKVAADFDLSNKGDPISRVRKTYSPMQVPD